MNAPDKKSYAERYRGRFQGLLQWRDWDQFRKKLNDRPDGWYVYQPMESGKPPLTCETASAFTSLLNEIDEFLRREQRADYCGAVYVDDRDAPTFVKIFHPRKMGSSCGCSGEPVLPWWTLTRMAPERLAELQQKAEQTGGLLNGLMGPK